MSKSFTLTDKISLKVVARNFKDGEKIQGHLKLLDENKKELSKKEFETFVNNYKSKYSFITEKVAKSLGVNPEEVYYVKGWMDSDNDRVIDYNEEVLIEIAEPKILDGFWLNNKNEKITLSQEDTDVKIKITTSNVLDGTRINGKVLKSLFGYDKEIGTFSGNINNNKAVIDFKLDNKIVKDDSSEIEKLYFEVELVYGKREILKELPLKEDNYLQVVERAVLVSVFVEMPEDLTEAEIKSSPNISDQIAQRANDLGLSGHAAISINQEYYDYGPSGAYYYSPGQPWWDAFAHGEGRGSVNISNTRGKDYNTVKSYISKIAKSGAEIYEIKFLVTINQAKILKDWWDNKYNNLGTYSVAGAIGSHCTNTVMESLYEASIIGNGLEYLSYHTEIAEPYEFYNNYMKKVKHSAGFLINGDIPNNLENVPLNATPAVEKKAEITKL